MNVLKNHCEFLPMDTLLDKSVQTITNYTCKNNEEMNSWQNGDRSEKTAKQ